MITVPEQRAELLKELGIVPELGNYETIVSRISRMGGDVDGALDFWIRTQFPWKTRTAEFTDSTEWFYSAIQTIANTDINEAIKIYTRIEKQGKAAPKSISDVVTLTGDVLQELPGYTTAYQT